MAKSAKKNRVQKEVERKDIDSVLFQVAGVFTHGIAKGRTNPNATVDMRLYAGWMVGRRRYTYPAPGAIRETVQQVCQRLKAQTGGAFYRILEVVPA